MRHRACIHQRVVAEQHRGQQRAIARIGKTRHRLRKHDAQRDAVEDDTCERACRVAAQRGAGIHGDAPRSASRVEPIANAHAPAAFALHFADAQHALAGRDVEPHRSARDDRARRCDRCAAIARAAQMRMRSPSDVGFRDRPRIERANFAFQRDRRRPSSRCRASALSILCAYVDAGFGLRAWCELLATRDARATLRCSVCAPSAASLSCSEPPVSSAAIGVRRSSRIGPVSRPASICMRSTPVSSSPARIARWIGAAPRQRGSSEACTFQQPRRGIASTLARQDQTVGDDDHEIGHVIARVVACAILSLSETGCSTAMPAASARCLTRTCAQFASAPGRTIRLRVDRDDRRLAPHAHARRHGTRELRRSREHQAQSSRIHGRRAFSAAVAGSAACRRCLSSFLRTSSRLSGER